MIKYNFCQSKILIPITNFDISHKQPYQKSSNYDALFGAKLLWTPGGLLIRVSLTQYHSAQFFDTPVDAIPVISAL